MEPSIKAERITYIKMAARALDISPATWDVSRGPILELARLGKSAIKRTEIDLRSRSADGSPGSFVINAVNL
jgi:hypothetical protein